MRARAVALAVVATAAVAAWIGPLAHPAPADSALSSNPGGYWLVASDGGIFAFGAVPFLGSTGALPLTQPVVGMAPTPSGRGYWLVASDGGIFAFGDARFFGSTGGLRLNRPIVGMAASPSGRGYWLVASDGGIFAYGDAGFSGSTGGLRLNKPIVGMAAAPSGRGYWLVASDGGIFAFGAAPFLGSTGATPLNQPIVAMTTSLGGGGYFLVAADGGIFAYGDARFRGSTGGLKLTRPVVGMAVAPSTNPYVPGTSGYDISWPQCNKTAYPSLPAEPFAFAIVGANGGTPFTPNPCLADELRWAVGHSLSIYLNTSMPAGAGADRGLTGPAGMCDPADAPCVFYNFGWNAANEAVDRVQAQGASPVMWWLDVETKNSWSTDTATNSRVVQGMLAAFDSRGLLVGVYSTSFQWGKLMGSYAPGRPLWVAGAPAASPASWCDPSHEFAGGKAWLTQYVNVFDTDYAC